MQQLVSSYPFMFQSSHCYRQQSEKAMCQTHAMSRHQHEMIPFETNPSAAMNPMLNIRDTHTTQLNAIFRTDLSMVYVIFMNANHSDKNNVEHIIIHRQLSGATLMGRFVSTFLFTSVK
jgi:hypothetical protein